MIVFLVLRVIFKIIWGWGELFCWFLFDWVLIDLLSKQVHAQKHNFVSDGTDMLRENTAYLYQVE